MVQSNVYIVDVTIPLASGLTTFTPHFRDLGITRGAVLRSIGYRHMEVPSGVLSAIQDILQEAPDHADPVCGFRLMPLDSIAVPEDRISCSEGDLLTGPVIAPLLTDAQTLAVFVATAGPGTHDWLSLLAGCHDELIAYIADSVGSLITEQVAEWLETRVSEMAARHGWQISNRYGPGYCGWPTSDQRALLAFLPEGFCGVRLTESAFMVPMKSVSGLLGLGPSIHRLGYQCAICEMQGCFRRRDEPHLPTT